MLQSLAVLLDLELQLDTGIAARHHVLGVARQLSLLEQLLYKLAISMTLLLATPMLLPAVTGEAPICVVITLHGRSPKTWLMAMRPLASLEEPKIHGAVLGMFSLSTFFSFSLLF